MFRRFNVKNFMSFSCNDKGLSEEFSMIPGKVRNMKEHIYDDSEIKLLKFAAIYGANASGKSNLIKAISCMKEILKKNSSKGYTDKYCRIGNDNRNKPSYFEVEIVLNKKMYSYGFEIVLNKSEFIAEWLIELKSNNEEEIIFERDIVKDKYEFCKSWLNDKELSNRLEIYMEDAKTEETSLFLNIINDKKESFYEKFPITNVLKEVYNWFFDNLVINEPNQPINGYNYFSSNEDMEKALQIIKTFGTGISKYKVISIEVDDFLDKLPGMLRKFVKNDIENHMIMVSKIKKEDNKSKIKELITLKNNKELFFIKLHDEEINCNIIKFYHSDSNSFDFGEESDGTQRLWDLLQVLLTEKNATFFIDEIDRCMHPSLTYKFVKNFFELSTNKNIQLIVTTHESRLLDFELLRRDEIWFIDKNKEGQSDIYSLEDYNERFDRKIDKAYLEGRYGGVPVFTSLFPIEESE